MRDIRVLIVDDSAVVRQVVSQVLSEAPGIQVMGAAPDPIFAMRRMMQDWPDVLVLDIEMPRMDGITFLKKIMAMRPTPVVICSTLTEKGAQITMEAMAAGAVGIVSKPKTGLKNFLEDQSALLTDAVRAAGRVNPARLRGARPVAAHPLDAPGHPWPMEMAPSQGLLSRNESTEQVVAIGTSTGGTQALEVVLTALPRTCPGLVIVQHMPEKFTAAFAARLDGICQIEVKEAADGDRVLPGRALIAPGGLHMQLKRSGAQYQVAVRDGPLVNRHRPGIDVLFRSVAKFAGRNALGVIMTGMGDDGAAGLLEMRQAGAHTLSEDESTCVVYGMPKEAVKRGAVERVVPLDGIPRAIMDYAAGSR